MVDKVKKGDSSMINMRVRIQSRNGQKSTVPKFNSPQTTHRFLKSPHQLKNPSICRSFLEVRHTNTRVVRDCESCAGFVYPVASHWAWAQQGWLKNLGYMDLGGSGVVHALGGTCALVAAIFLGPRIGRFHNGKPVDMPGHSMSVSLGNR